MRATRSTFRQLFHRLAATILALATVFSYAIPVADAMVPPASFPLFAFLQTCEVKVTVSPKRTGAQAGSIVIFSVTVQRLKGKSMPIRAAIGVDSNAIDAAASGLVPGQIGVSDEEGDPNVVMFRTDDKIGTNQSVTANIQLQVKSSATVGTLTQLPVAVTSLGADGRPGRCQSTGDQAVLEVSAQPIYDLAIDLEYIGNKNQAVQKGQLLPFVAKVRNTEAANTAVPVGRSIKVTYTYESATRVVGYEPSSLCDPNAAPDSCVDVLEKGLVPGETSATPFNSVFEAVSGSLFYKVTACVAPVNERANEEQPDDNNCDTETVTGSPLEVIKAWDNNTNTLKQKVKAGDTLSYKIRVKNVSSQTVNNISLRDQLMTDLNCNAIFDTSCPAWDKTVEWVKPLPSGITESADSTLTWNNTFSLTPGQAELFELQAKVIDLETLNAKLEANGYKDPCNAAVATIAGHPGLATSRVCWDYDKPQSDMVVTKRIKQDNQSVKQVTLYEGQVGTYEIGVQNKGKHVAKGIQFYDQLVESATTTTGTKMTAWDLDSIEEGIVANNTTQQLNGWPLPEMQPGESKMITPRVAIACDALRNLSLFDRLSAAVDNTATVTAANDDTNNNRSETVRINIKDGHYNLGGYGTALPAKVIPGQANSNQATLSIVLTNQGEGVNVAVPGVQARFELPKEFEVVADASNSPHQVVNGEIVFNRVDVSVDGTARLSLKVRVKDDVPTGTAKFDIKARSVTASQTCGVTRFAVPLDIEGPDYQLTKEVLPPANTEGLQRGQTGRFQLKVTNYTAYNINHELEIIDPLDPAFEYVQGSAVCSSPDNAKFNCSTDITGPEANGQTLTWKVKSLKTGGTLVLDFGVKVRDETLFDVCPKPIHNSPASLPLAQRAIIRDTVFGNIKAFPTASISVYADRCLDGNLYARSDGGIEIQSKEVVVDADSILSARGTVVCNEENASCVNAPYKIGNYQTSEGNSAINWETILTRMQRNLDRLLPQADQFGRGGRLSGSFNLYRNETEAVRYPEGRVWKHTTTDQSPAFIINTDNLQLSGVGTIIVEGDIRITGSGELSPAGSAKNSLGLIALPVGGRGGNIYIDGSVKKITNTAMYAPGTATGRIQDSINKDEEVASGIITIESGPEALRPAKGLFIGRKFVIPADKRAVFQYDAALNTAAGAPPGFSFTTSPSTTQEGS